MRGARRIPSRGRRAYLQAEGPGPPGKPPCALPHPGPSGSPHRFSWRPGGWRKWPGRVLRLLPTGKAQKKGETRDTSASPHPNSVSPFPVYATRPPKKNRERAPTEGPEARCPRRPVASRRGRGRCSPRGHGPGRKRPTWPRRGGGGGAAAWCCPRLGNQSRSPGLGTSPGRGALSDWHPSGPRPRPQEAEGTGLA